MPTRSIGTTCFVPITTATCRSLARATVPVNRSVLVITSGVAGWCRQQHCGDRENQPLHVCAIDITGPSDETVGTLVLLASALAASETVVTSDVTP